MSILVERLTAILFIRGVFWIFCAFCLLSTFYFLAIFGSMDELAQCCDAALYLDGGSRLFSEGLLFEHGYIGYRSVLNYAVVGVVRAIGAPFATFTGWAGRAEVAYAYGAMLLYASTALALLAYAGRQSGFLPVFGAVYLNPLSFAYLLYPLQESQMVLLLGPGIVLVVVSLKQANWARSITLLWAFAALSWMVKSSLILVALPVVALAFYLAKNKQVRWSTLLVGAVISAALIAPQSYVALERLGTIYPYPNNRILEKQLEWGYTAWHYETVHDGDWKGDFAKNPYAPIKGGDEYLSRMQEAPLEVMSLWVGHVFSAFNHSQLKVYVTDPAERFALFNILVGIVIFLGGMTWVGLVARGPYSSYDFFVDVVMVGSAAALPILAVETRFSFLAMIVLSYRALQWCTTAGRNGRLPEELTGAALFGLLFAFAMLLVDTAS